MEKVEILVIHSGHRRPGFDPPYGIDVNPRFADNQTHWRGKGSETKNNEKHNTMRLDLLCRGTVPIGVEETRQRMSLICTHSKEKEQHRGWRTLEVFLNPVPHRMCL